MNTNFQKHLTIEARLAIFLLVVFSLIFYGSNLIIKTLNSEIPVVEVLPEHLISMREIVRGNTSKQQVIFTFDGGAVADSTDQILSILSKHQVKGTFFLTGKFVETYPDLVRKIVSGGHEIFSHTYDHPHLTGLSDAEISAEFMKMEQSLETVAGISPKPYFRAPYGDRNLRVERRAFKEGYQSVYWTVDAGDWEESTGMTAAEVKNKILTNLAPGNIFLMHLGDKITGDILDEIFTTIESKGYKIISLTQGI